MEFLLFILGCGLTTVAALNSSDHAVRAERTPDETRLYRELMADYENSIRPILNASNTLVIDFELTLTQITDLDERSQVLTTNVFIDQTWRDEKLVWEPADHSNIHSMRIPESRVWLPDTFLFNNADDGSTGFMRGMFVLVRNDGTVLWRVPVKLKSSCKVDIAYFPFDDQVCHWKFGSWIYSGAWIDFNSSIHSIYLDGFIDNSEWDLRAIRFDKSYRHHPSSGERHPDLLFTLHIRRRTLYYMFNIIAPCVMLSVLTLLTFWLPPTSGEKISLGLSVFLAFSMFMLLIAEEVPATSESVPLIGVYLTTVMTMTSVSVIMAVLVINLYNRGSKATRAPGWLKFLLLEGLARALRLKHDVDAMTSVIKLDRDEEEKYSCLAHTPAPSVSDLGGGGVTSARSREPRPCGYCDSNRALDEVTRLEELHDDGACLYCRPGDAGIRMRTVSDALQRETDFDAGYDDTKTNSKKKHSKLNGFLRKSKPPARADCAEQVGKVKSRSRAKQRASGDGGSATPAASNISTIPSIFVTSADMSREASRSRSSSPVWRKRESVILREERQRRSEEQSLLRRTRDTAAAAGCSTIESLDLSHNSFVSTTAAPTPPQRGGGGASDAGRDRTHIPRLAIECPKKAALVERRQTVAEWHTIATVVDRFLFFLFLLGTIIAYIVILFIIPGTKPRYSTFDDAYSVINLRPNIHN